MSEENTQIDTELNRLYELSFNLIPTEGEDGSIKDFDTIKKLIEKKGKLVSESKPASIKLAYTMSKTVDSKKSSYNNAYFAWIKFESQSEDIAHLKEELDLNNALLRYTIFKTEKDTNIQAEDVAKFLNKEDSDSEESSYANKKAKKDKDTEEKVVEKKKKEEKAEEEKEEKEVKEKDEDKKEAAVDKAIDELVA